LGILILELAKGSAPYASEHTLDALTKIYTEPAPVLEGYFSEDAIQFVAYVLNKDPNSVLFFLIFFFSFFSIQAFQSNKLLINLETIFNRTPFTSIFIIQKN